MVIYSEQEEAKEENGFEKIAEINLKPVVKDIFSGIDELIEYVKTFTDSLNLKNKKKLMETEKMKPVVAGTGKQKIEAFVAALENLAEKKEEKLKPVAAMNTEKIKIKEEKKNFSGSWKSIYTENLAEFLMETYK